MKPLILIAEAKPRAGYPFANAFPLAAQLSEHLDDGVESVKLAVDIADGDKDKIKLLREYEKIARKIIPLLGDLQDILSDLEE
jgi:hypothetical protein